MKKATVPQGSVGRRRESKHGARECEELGKSGTLRDQEAEISRVAHIKGTSKKRKRKKKIVTGSRTAGIPKGLVSHL